MKYKEGDVLFDGDYRRKVLGVCGLVYIMSCEDDFFIANTFQTEEELDGEGFVIDDQEAELAFLIDEKEKELDELYRQHRDNGGE